MTNFVPKQCFPRDPALFREITGHTLEDVASQMIALVPPLTSSSTVHDNGYGTGTVTKAIMTSDTTPGLIHATDIDPTMVSAVQATAASQGWTNVEASTMSADALTFPADTFTHSLANFLVHLLRNDAAAVQQIHHTLAPDGAAALSFCHETITVEAAIAAHNAVRPGMPLPAGLARPEFSTASLRVLLERAGLAPEAIRFSQVSAAHPIEDVRRRAQLAWSFLGPAPGGWTQRDEDDWDVAIDRIVGVLDGYEGFERGRVALERR